MNKFVSIAAAALLPALFAGCAGVGPNTQQGAVAGGVLGAVAGAVLGHNSRGGDALGGAILGGTAGAIAGGAIGNSVDHERGTIYNGPYDGPPRRVYRSVEQTVVPPPAPPPPNRDVVTPSPAPNAIWIPGYWSYDGRGYSWVAGHWEIPPPIATAYVAAHWEFRDGNYVFVPSYWR